MEEWQSEALVFNLPYTLAEHHLCGPNSATACKVPKHGSFGPVKVHVDNLSHSKHTYNRCFAREQLLGKQTCQEKGGLH